MPRIFDAIRSRRYLVNGVKDLGPGAFHREQIVRAHGGNLEVDASEGTTSFQLVLPRSPQSGQGQTLSIIAKSGASGAAFDDAARSE